MNSVPDFYLIEGYNVKDPGYLFGSELNRTFGGMVVITCQPMKQFAGKTLKELMQITYPDGKWEESDTSGYEYMYKSYTYLQEWGDYLYIYMLDDNGQFGSNVKFGSNDKAGMVKYASRLLGQT